MAELSFIISEVKNPPADARDAKDLDLIPGLVRKIPREGNGNPFWEVPWTEEPGRLQSMRLQRVRHD